MARNDKYIKGSTWYILGFGIKVMVIEDEKTLYPQCEVIEIHPGCNTSKLVGDIITLRSNTLYPRFNRASKK